MSDQPGPDSQGNDPSSRKNWVPLGNGHWLRYYRGRESELQIGIIVLHINPKTGIWCEGSVLFDLPEAQRYRNKKPDGTLTHVWQLISREPLHLEPSLLCKGLTGPSDDSGKATECGDHGWIRDGKWVNA